MILARDHVVPAVCYDREIARAGSQGISCVRFFVGKENEPMRKYVINADFLYPLKGIFTPEEDGKKVSDE